MNLSIFTLKGMIERLSTSPTRDALGHAGSSAAQSTNGSNLNQTLHSPISRTTALPSQRADGSDEVHLPREAEIESHLPSKRANEDISSKDEHIGKGLIPSDISPLPNEILMLVFAAVRQLEIELLEQSGRLEPPITSQVCQGWRTLSLAMAQLWSTIIIHFTVSEDLTSSISLTSLFLQRSKGFPLDVCITIRDWDHNVVNLINSFDPIRWRTVQFNLGSSYYETMGCFGVDSDFPLLTSLSLNIIPGLHFRPPTVQKNRISIRNAPKLKHLSISPDSRILELYTTLDIPFHQMDLRHWSGFVSPFELQDLLKFCKNLDYFQYSGVQFAELSPVVTHPQPLPSHKSLSTLFLSSYKDEMFSLLPKSLPNLRRICLRDAISPDYRFDNLVSLFQTHGHQFESFIVDASIPLEITITCIDLSPNLTILHTANLPIGWLRTSLTRNTNNTNPAQLAKLHTLGLGILKLSRAPQVLDIWQIQISNGTHSGNLKIYLSLPLVEHDGEIISQLQKTWLARGIDVHFRQPIWWRDNQYLTDLLI